MLIGVSYGSEILTYRDHLTVPQAVARVLAEAPTARDHVSIGLIFSTHVAAQAFHASVPKSAKARLVNISGLDVNGLILEPKPYVTIYVKLASDDVNGGRNETGQRRLTAFLKALKGLTV